MRLTLRLKPELHKALKERAEEKGISLNSIIVIALWQFVNERI